MPPPVALQLYTLRELADKNYERVVNLTAEIGYAGVEPGRFSPAPRRRRPAGCSNR